ncbi:unnamed protein product [Rhizoctonia solani]|uniref:Uncharacterized protein n=1 Tax=Rhizoctonia solani TaxID=456999 RepID=A0A8H3CUK6_9AGAM|nr:unnamed protein product [Rhizoctonia solani]
MLEMGDVIWGEVRHHPPSHTLWYFLACFSHNLRLWLDTSSMQMYDGGDRTDPERSTRLMFPRLEALTYTLLV